MADDLTPEAARETLASAATSSGRLRSQARWASRKLAIYGAGFGLITVAVGMFESQALGFAVFAAWAVLVGTMVFWERRRPAHLRGTSTRIGPYWTGTIVFYVIALGVGTQQQSGDGAYWIPAGVIVALPMLIGAVREQRA